MELRKNIIAENEFRYEFAKKTFLDSSTICLETLYSKEMDELFIQHKNHPNKEKEITEFMLKLIACISGLKFFMTLEILMRLQEFRDGEHGVNNSVKALLIPIDKIKAEIDEINRSGLVYIDPYKTIIIIRNYLNSQLIDAVQKCFGFKTKKVGNQKTFLNTTTAYFKKFESSEKRFEKLKNLDRELSSFQQNMKDLLLKIADGNKELGVTEDPYKSIQNELKGNNADLKLLISNEFYFRFNDDIGKEDFYIVFYPLFRLICSSDVYSDDELKATTYSGDTRTLKKYFYNDVIKNRYGITD